MSVKGGRKIYRASTSYRKRKARKAAKIFFVILLLAAIVFLGYCVARPVIEYLSDKNGESASASDNAPWTPPAVPDDDEQIQENDANDDKVREKDTEEDQTEDDVNGFSAYRLPVSALSSPDALTEALSYAKESGYTAVIAVLKDEGGKIYYNTASDMAKSDETAIVGTMYAGQICSMINAAGFTPIAEINLLEDNNRYGMNRDGSYHLLSDNSAWLDNAPAKGGKPWLSPFDPDTQSYAEFLSNEAASSGFEYIVFDGLVFPYFRNSDLNYIGDIVKSPERYKALINIENISADIAVKNTSVPIVMISAGDILSGKAEVFKPDELAAGMIAVSYIPSEMEGTAVINGQEVAVSELAAYDRAKAVLGEIKRLSGEGKIIVPVIRQSDFSQADFSEIIKAAMDLGMDSYIVM